MPAHRISQAAKLAAPLEHPDIVRVLDWGEATGRPYVVIESRDAVLQQIVAPSQTFSEEHALTVLVRLANALAHLHENSVVYQFVEPGSIDVDLQRGFVRLSWPVWACPQGTRPIVAAYCFASPEFFAGDCAAPPIDIYGLGVLGFFMLTGRRPFKGTRSEVRRQILSHDRPLLRELRADITAPTAELIQACLSRFPGNRPASAREFERQAVGILRRIRGL